VCKKPTKVGPICSHVNLINSNQSASRPNSAWSITSDLSFLDSDSKQRRVDEKSLISSFFFSVQNSFELIVFALLLLLLLLFELD
jgi:hypothetical protein